MQTSDFELAVAVAPDARLVATVRDLARSAAQMAGCSEEAAEAFCREVEVAVRDSMLDGAATQMLPVRFRYRNRALEADVDGRTLILDARG